MGDVAAIGGAVFLLAGIVIVALLGNSRAASWAPTVGVALILLGLGIELVGAVVMAG